MMVTSMMPLLLANRFGLGNDFLTRYINKSPADGLTGKTDEENLGFTYKTLDTYIEYGFGGFTPIGRKELGSQIDNIIQMHDSSEHKRNLPYTTENFPL